MQYDTCNDAGVEGMSFANHSTYNDVQVHSILIPTNQPLANILISIEKRLKG